MHLGHFSGCRQPLAAERTIHGNLLVHRIAYPTLRFQAETAMPASDYVLISNIHFWIFMRSFGQCLLGVCISLALLGSIFRWNSHAQECSSEESRKSKRYAIKRHKAPLSADYRTDNYRVRWWICDALTVRGDPCSCRLTTCKSLITRSWR